MWWSSTPAEKTSAGEKADATDVDIEAPTILATTAAAAAESASDAEGGRAEGTPKETGEERRDPFHLLWAGMSELGSRDGQGARSFSHVLNVHGVDCTAIAAADCKSTLRPFLTSTPPPYSHHYHLVRPLAVDEQQSTTRWQQGVSDCRDELLPVQLGGALREAETTSRAPRALRPPQRQRPQRVRHKRKQQGAKIFPLPGTSRLLSGDRQLYAEL